MGELSGLEGLELELELLGVGEVELYIVLGDLLLVTEHGDEGLQQIGEIGLFVVFEQGVDALDQLFVNLLGSVIESLTGVALLELSDLGIDLFDFALLKINLALEVLELAL